ELWKKLNELVCDASAVKDQPEQQLNVWPNPSASGWTVSGLPTQGRLELFDGQGRLIFERELKNQDQVDIPLMRTDGFYEMRVISGKTVVSKRLIQVGR
ncbi:MAG: T9SS type A sorting domain-containing protein, partial [Saprospiraceae bacterium]|nr:T9SS type A sorting domain-containing protein [Saprospiraceae bacterium]